MLKIESRIFEVKFTDDESRKKANEEINKKVSEFLSFFGDAVVDYDISMNVSALQKEFFMTAMIVLRHRAQANKSW